EIGDRPAAEIKIQGSKSAGELHEECKKAVQGWVPDSGVLFLVDTGGMEEIEAREFWVQMNGLRESWAFLQCHIVFFLLPGNYRRFLQIADHLADWVPLKFHFTGPPFNFADYHGEGSRDFFSSDELDLSPRAAHQLISALEPELATALLGGEEKPILIRRFYFPMFKAALAIGEIQRAKSLRSHIKESDIRTSDLPDWWDLNFKLDFFLGNTNALKEDAVKLKIWAEKHHHLKWMARSYHNMGIAFQEKNNLTIAERWYQDSLKICEKIGYKYGIASIYHSLGILARKQSKFEEAEKWVRKSLEISKWIGNKIGEASNCYLLGQIAEKEGDFSEAKKWYLEAMHLNEEQGDQDGLAITYHQFGMIAEIEGYYENAENYFRKAIEIAEKLHNELLAANAYFQLGKVKGKTGNSEEAGKWIIKALSIYHNLEEQVPYKTALKNYTELIEKGGPGTQTKLRRLWENSGLPPLPQPQNAIKSQSTPLLRGERGNDKTVQETKTHHTEKELIP
ncbi:MAG: tetratricopeptide repeat protein, partial [Desulfococcaceae bacterium]